jgi:hypothetical protein
MPIAFSSAAVDLNVASGGMSPSRTIHIRTEGRKRIPSVGASKACRSKEALLTRVRFFVCGHFTVLCTPTSE